MLDDGLPFCDELPNWFDRYERMSFDPFVLTQQTTDPDVCPRCYDAWNAGVDELDELDAIP